jgi:hypothetical protein
MAGAAFSYRGGRYLAGLCAAPTPGRVRFSLIPAGEAAGIGVLVPCYNSDRLSNQPFQILRKRTEQTLGIRMVGKQPNDVGALEGGQ